MDIINLVILLVAAVCVNDCRICAVFVWSLILSPNKTKSKYYAAIYLIKTHISGIILSYC